MIRSFLSISFIGEGRIEKSLYALRAQIQLFAGDAKNAFAELLDEALVQPGGGGPEVALVWEEEPGAEGGLGEWDAFSVGEMKEKAFTAAKGSEGPLNQVSGEAEAFGFEDSRCGGGEDAVANGDTHGIFGGSSAEPAQKNDPKEPSETSSALVGKEGGGAGVLREPDHEGLPLFLYEVPGVAVVAAGLEEAWHMETVEGAEGRVASLEEALGEIEAAEVGFFLGGLVLEEGRDPLLEPCLEVDAKIAPFAESREMGFDQTLPQLRGEGRRGGIILGAWPTHLDSLHCGSKVQGATWGLGNSVFFFRGWLPKLGSDFG